MTSPIMSEDLSELIAQYASRKKLAEDAYAKGFRNGTSALATQLAETQRLLDNARQIERNVQAVREHEYKRAEAALAELARVTREAEIHRSSAVDNYEKWATSHAQLAALTEALKETAAILQAAVVAGKVRGGDSYRIGGVYLQTVSDALDAADTALTTDKEPKI